MRAVKNLNVSTYYETHIALIKFDSTVENVPLGQRGKLIDTYRLDIFGIKKVYDFATPRSSFTIGPYSLCKDVNAWWYLSRSKGPKIYFVASKFIYIKELSKVYNIFLCLVKRCYAVLITSIPVASFRSMDKA